ncbi:MAG TPA: hypothetical protein VMH48_08250 [Methylomirabilota bacterium]|nr:hypothetical protein [Methylomirabilota bacterium]
MEEYQQENQNGNRLEPTKVNANRWLLLAVVALFVAAGLAFGYGYRQQMMVGHLSAQESMANATINQLQGQVNTLTAKLNDMAAAQEAAAAKAAAQSASAAPGKASAGARPATKRGITAADKRYKELQAKLEEQQKQLKETQDLVAKNRSDLEGSLSSTRDELNGSIAKTHEELVALEKKGERSYYEFDLEKSKQFQRVGPLTLSLRKADTKHKSFDVQMIVDDNRLTKKNVNLYEPIWIHSETDGQPVQVVVNRIEKNLVHGYVSGPKYKPAELAAATGANVTPVAAHPQTPENPPSSPKQPE